MNLSKQPGLCKSGKLLLLLGQIQSCTCSFPAALMHRGVGRLPGLTNFAVRLCGLWEIPRITFDPPQAPKAIYLSEVRGSWVTAVWEPQPEIINLYAHTHTHTQDLYLFNLLFLTPWSAAIAEFTPNGPGLEESCSAAGRYWNRGLDYSEYRDISCSALQLPLGVRGRRTTVQHDSVHSHRDGLSGPSSRILEMKLIRKR